MRDRANDARTTCSLQNAAKSGQQIRGIAPDFHRFICCDYFAAVFSLGHAGGANLARSWPWSFQMRRTLSRPPARIVLPSALVATEYMYSAGPLKSRWLLPFVELMKRTFESPPQATSMSSATKLTLVTSFVNWFCTVRS